MAGDGAISGKTSSAFDDNDDDASLSAWRGKDDETCGWNATFAIGFVTPKALTEWGDSKRATRPRRAAENFMIAIMLRFCIVGCCLLLTNIFVFSLVGGLVPHYVDLCIEFNIFLYFEDRIV